jgi:hypothetical protein
MSPPPTRRSVAANQKVELEDLQFRFQSKPGLVLSTTNTRPVLDITTREPFAVYSEFDERKEHIVVAVKNHSGATEFITEVSVRNDFDYRGHVTDDSREAMRLGAALSIASVFVGARFLFETRKSMLLKESASSGKQGDSSQSAKRQPCIGHDKVPRDCGRLADGTYRMPHDLVCTAFIPVDGKFKVRLNGLLCRQDITVELFDCCVKHDIALWCAENDLQAMAADQAVVACVNSEIMSQMISKAQGPFCVLAALVSSVVTALISQIVAAIGALFVWYCHDRNLIGYNGRNKDSCLCGGNAPTRLCSGDRCVDVCQRRYSTSPSTAYGRVPQCSTCRLECVYDSRTGIAIGWRHANDRPIPCCVGTTQDCLTKNRNIRKDCPDRCSVCEWQCIRDKRKDGTWDVRWYHFQEHKDLPCCGGRKPKPDDSKCSVPEFDRPYSENVGGVPDSQERGGSV